MWGEGGAATLAPDASAEGARGTALRASLEGSPGLISQGRDGEVGLATWGVGKVFFG